MYGFLHNVLVVPSTFEFSQWQERPEWERGEKAVLSSLYKLLQISSHLEVWPGSATAHGWNSALLTHACFMIALYQYSSNLFSFFAYFSDITYRKGFSSLSSSHLSLILLFFSSYVIIFHHKKSYLNTSLVLLLPFLLACYLVDTELSSFLGVFFS